MAHFTHLDGERSEFTRSEFGKLLAEPDRADAAHSNVAVTNDRADCISLFPSGLVVVENRAGGFGPVRKVVKDDTEASELVLELASGDLIPFQDWDAGDGPKGETRWR